MVEYALMIALLTLVLVAIFQLTGTRIRDKFNQTDNALAQTTS